MKNDYLKIGKTYFILFSIFYFLFSTQVLAANLYFLPAAGSYAVGKTFSVSVYVNSIDQAMNAAAGIVSFPQDKVEVTSISKAGSIFNLWVQEPTFSNNAGTINFEGIVLNPGYIGSGAKIITINFRGRAGGSVPLSYSSGSVLANDGKGTNILENLRTAQFNLARTEPAAAESSNPSEISDVPLATKISSPTHPDPEKWYANNNPQFNWVLSKDVTGVSFIADKSPSTNPGAKSFGLINSYTYSGVKDGAWYIHLRLKNSVGWGGVSHFRFQIDTEKPDHFDITEMEKQDLTDPKARFMFDASDQVSGIDYYAVQIDDQEPQGWKDDGVHVYQTLPLDPGKHKLIAKAVDKAGNYLANFAEFNIASIDPPKITEYPEKIENNQIMVVKGVTYPNSEVIFWVQFDGEEAQSQNVRSDRKGNFTVVYQDHLKDGLYSIWAQVVDRRGAKSYPSEKLPVLVSQGTFLKWGYLTVNFLGVATPLVAVLLLLLFIFWYAWHRFRDLKNRLGKEIKEEHGLRRTFSLLRQDIQDQVRMLEKARERRHLTEEEVKILNQLKKRLKGISGL